MREWIHRALHRPFLTLAGLTLLAGVVGILGGLLLLFNLSRTLPPMELIESYEIPSPTVVYDRNHEILHEFYTERRRIARLDEIPPRVWRAFVEVEDRYFFQHWGVRPLSILRALLVNLRAGRTVQGGSTITQQLARNLFLTQKRTLRRKLEEALLAVRLERTFSKEEILERYLNLIYFGHGVYGIKAAAKYYFNKELNELTPLEIAVLVGLPKSPVLYSPIRHPDRSLARAHAILRTLHERGLLDDSSFTQAMQESLVVRPPEEQDQVAFGRYALEMIRQYVIDRYGEKFLYEGGGAIYTTLDRTMQWVADSVVDTLLTLLEKRYRLHPTREEWLTDSTLKEKYPQPPYLQAALISLNPRTGEIYAVVGGRNFSESQFNRVIQMRRQPGSAFKPFVFLAALDNGYQPSDFVEDEPLGMQLGPREKPWVPENYDGKYLGRITLRTALARSRNLATIRLGMVVGPSVVAQYARLLGIESTIPPYPSSLIGSATLSLWELARAYAAIANYGHRIRPFFIQRIVDRGGEVLEENFPIQIQVLDSSTLYLLISMMESVMNEGTGRSARTRYHFTLPAAGKTGTTNDNRDTWFMGFTPGLLTGVWVGYDSLRPIRHGATGAAMALPIWATFMREVTDTTDTTGFPVPSGVTTLSICAETGLLPTPYCPTREEVFRAGMVPTDTCRIHRGPLSPTSPYRTLEEEERQFLREEGVGF